MHGTDPNNTAKQIFYEVEIELLLEVRGTHINADKNILHIISQHKNSLRWLGAEFQKKRIMCEIN